MVAWLKSLDPLVGAAVVNGIMLAIVALANGVFQFVRARKESEDQKDPAAVQAAKNAIEAADGAVELALKVHDREISMLKAEINDLYSGIGILIKQLEQYEIKPAWKPRRMNGRDLEVSINK